MANTNDRTQAPWETEYLLREVQRSQARRVRALWVAVVVLAVALAAQTTYGYMAWQKLNVAVAQLPGLGDSLATLSGRMEAAEAKLSVALSDWNGLGERVAKLDHKVSSNLQLARKQAQQMVSQLQARLETELNERTRVLEVRLDRLESNQEAQRVYMARLQEQIETVQRETGLHLDNLGEQLARNQSQTDALAQRLDTERVDFEVARKRTQEIVPGVSMTLTKTNVSYQRFSGWLWLLPDRRTVWVRNQGVQQPVVIYRKPTGERCEVVVTDVTKDFVIGYLLRAAAGSRGAGERAEANIAGSPGPHPPSPEAPGPEKIRVFGGEP